MRNQSVAAAKDAQQVQEQVDEVEIERQGTHRGDLAEHRGVGLGTHALDSLGIPCGKSHKDEYTSHTDAPCHHGALQEDVDNHADKQSDESHEHEGAKLGQVLTGGVAHDGHHAEHASSDGKGQGDASACVNQQDGRQGDAVQDAVGIEQRGGGAAAQLVDAGAEVNHQTQLKAKQHEVGQAAGEEHAHDCRA